MSLTGTSMAAPMVSGTAALVLSILGATTNNYFQVSRQRPPIRHCGTAVPLTGHCDAAVFCPLEVQCLIQVTPFTNSHT